MAHSLQKVKVARFDTIDLVNLVGTFGRRCSVGTSPYASILPPLPGWWSIPYTAILYPILTNLRRMLIPLNHCSYMDVSSCKSIPAFSRLQEKTAFTFLAPRGGTVPVRGSVTEVLWESAGGTKDVWIELCDADTVRV